MAARTVVVEAQDTLPLGRDAHQPEGHALADGRQVEHTAVGGQERQPVFLHEAADAPGRVALAGQRRIQFRGLPLGHPPEELLFLLLLHRTAVGREDGVVFAEALHREGIVTDHAQRVEHLPQAGGMPAARCRDGIYQLVGDEPPGGKYLPDSLPRLGRHLQRRLEMRLDDELLHADGRGLLPELLQHLHQLVVDAHRQVSRQARPQPHALQLGIFFTIGTRLVGLALAAGHAVDRLEDIAQRLVLAHQGVAARDEDVAQLRVLLEISHQAAQFVIPALLGAQALELEIEPFALEVVHPLARGAQPAAGTPHRIGDQDRHFGITAVDIVPVGQQPPGRIGFSGLDDVLLLPGADIPVGLDQLRRIEDIAADRLVVVRFAGDVQQREVIRRGEERHPLLAGLRQQVHGLRRKRVAQKPVQLRRALHGHRQVEPEIAPPDAYLTVFILVGHPFLETEPRRGRLAVLDLLHQEVEHTLPVPGAHLRHLGIEPRRPAIVADTDALRRERLQLQPLKALELEKQVDEQVATHLRVLQPPREELPQQFQRPHGHLLTGRKFAHLPPVVADQQADLFRRLALRRRMPGDELFEPGPELPGIAARIGLGNKSRQLLAEKQPELVKRE